MPGDVEFGVSLNTDERVQVDQIIALLRSIEAMFKDIERHVVPGAHAGTKWAWAEDARLRFVASANGVEESSLSQIVATAREGFERAQGATRSQRPVEWPAEFGPEARKSAESILRQLEHLESLTVETTGHPPIEIREARLEQVVKGQYVRRVYSSVEGVLELIAHRGGTLRVGVREHNTGRYVKCTLHADAWLGRLRDLDLFDRRVIVEGRVAYDDEGRPLSVVDVTDISPREPGTRLRDFKGAAPELLDGLAIDGFLARTRGEALLKDPGLGLNPLPRPPGRS